MDSHGLARFAARFRPSRPQETFAHLLSQKPASYQDLSASCFLALVLLGLIHWDNPALNVLRVVVGLVVGLVLPGYALLGVLCPRKSQLDGLERWGLSMVLSAIVV